MTTSFSVVIKGETRSFSLNSQQYGSQTFVQTNLYRPAILENKPSGSLAGAFMGNIDLALKEEFINDLNYQVAYVNNSSEPEGTQVLFDACCSACHQHVNRVGRLMLADMFSYLDIFAILLQACSNMTNQQIQNIYLQGVKAIGQNMNQYVKCPGMFGAMSDFSTWAKNKGI